MYLGINTGNGSGDPLPGIHTAKKNFEILKKSFAVSKLCVSLCPIQDASNQASKHTYRGTNVMTEY